MILGPRRLRFEQQHQLRHQIGDAVRGPLDDRLVRQPQGARPANRSTSRPGAARGRRLAEAVRSPDPAAMSDELLRLPHLLHSPRAVLTPPRQTRIQESDLESRRTPPRAPRSPDRRGAATVLRGTDPAPTRRRCTRCADSVIETTSCLNWLFREVSRPNEMEPGQMVREWISMLRLPYLGGNRRGIPALAGLAISPRQRTRIRRRGQRCQQPRLRIRALR